jgi:hypothetical protein
VAGKFGLLSTEPLTLFNIRFLSAGILLLILSLFQEKPRLPVKSEFSQLTIFGALNTALRHIYHRPEASCCGNHHIDACPKSFDDKHTHFALA